MGSHDKARHTGIFAQHTLSRLWAKSDYELEGYGRLTHPMKYDPQSDTFRPVEWDEAFARIGEVLRGLAPEQVEFYTSGRASNEAAFLYQLFARELGTNNFPDCSNMCHQATSVGLPCPSASVKAPSRWKILTIPTGNFHRP